MARFPQIFADFHRFAKKKACMQISKALCWAFNSAVREAVVMSSGNEYKYEVVVSNIGTVYRSNTRRLAQMNFENYLQLSGQKVGRAAGEIVTLFADGMIIAQTKGEHHE